MDSLRLLNLLGFLHKYRTLTSKRNHLNAHIHSPLFLLLHFVVAKIILEMSNHIQALRKIMVCSSISDLWNKWNIPGFVILSLSLQVFFKFGFKMFMSRSDPLNVCPSRLGRLNRDIPRRIADPFIWIHMQKQLINPQTTTRWDKKVWPILQKMHFYKHTGLYTEAYKNGSAFNKRELSYD